MFSGLRNARAKDRQFLHRQILLHAIDQNRTFHKRDITSYKTVYLHIINVVIAL